MPHDPIVLKQDVIEKSTAGGHDLVVQHKYVAPATVDEGIADDPFKDQDARIAATMMKWLNEKYPGYPWATECDSRQGIVRFNIPILMGVDHWYVVNLRTHDVVDGLHKGAGEILERYRQPRDGFNLGAFLEARAKHSKLVLPHRAIPE